MFPSIKVISAYSYLSKLTSQNHSSANKSFFPLSGFLINTRMLPAYSFVLLPASISSSNEFESLYHGLNKLNENLVLTTDRLCGSLNTMGDRLEKRWDETDKKIDAMNNSVSAKLDERADRLEALIKRRNKA
jgi:hypothetical protein